MYKTKSGIVIPEKDKLIPIALDGSDGDVYKYLEHAVKFVSSSGAYLNLENLEKFITSLVHELLISPKEVLYDENDKWVGYLMDYMEDKKVTSLSCNKFLEGINNLKDCFELFTKNDIVVGDTHGGNVIVNDKIYMIDFDRFSFNDGKSKNLGVNNRRSYEKLIWSIIRYALLGRYPTYSWDTKDIPFAAWVTRNSLVNNDAFKYFESDMSSYNSMEDYIIDKRESILNTYSR